MTFSEIIQERYSCRGFQEREVEQDKIDVILEAARIAPTAVNFQPQKILVIKDKENLAKIAECTRFAFNAPLNFLICYDKTKSWHRRADNVDHGIVDASIVQTYMMLMAQELGLATTWVCAFDEPKVRELFEVPENYVIEGFMPTGYADMEPAKAHFERKTIDEIVSWEKF